MRRRRFRYVNLRFNMFQEREHTNDEPETRFSKEGICGIMISYFIEPFWRLQKCPTKNLSLKIEKRPVFAIFTIVHSPLEAE